MTRKQPSSSGSVSLAEVALQQEQDVIRLCRYAREAAERLHLGERSAQRLCAASFEVGQRLQALAPDTVATLRLVAPPSLEVHFQLSADRIGSEQTLHALMTPIASIVSRTGLASSEAGNAVTIGVDFAAGGPRLDPSLSDLLAARQRLGAAAVTAATAAVPGSPELLTADLQRELLETNRGIVGLYAELAEKTEQLRLAEHRLQLLLDSVQDYAICLLTTDGQISSTNVGAERLFECPAEEMVGRGFEQFYSPEDRDAGVPAAQLVRAERDGRVETDSIRLRRGPAEFDAHLLLTPVRDEARVLRGFSLVVRDITDRMKLEADLRRRAEDLAAANRAKEDFLATLSHELRTPLNAMLGWTRLLRMGKLDAAGVERALETIERNARIQEQLIADILDVSRIVTGKLRLVLRPVDLAPVLDATLDAVRPAAEAKDILLRPRLMVAGAVHGDPDRLQQVLWNLLANAIKFTPVGGEVDVDLVREGPSIVVQVRDTGQGIEPELLPYIFDRFRQGDASVTRPHGGIGLGLSIVRHIVELHGGQVSVSSEGAGRGTTFRVHLPMRTGVRSRTPAAADATSDGTGTAS